jgi:hypothetical protein
MVYVCPKNMTKSGTEMDKTAKPKRHKKELG